jgi:hypothetical protein
MTSIYLKLYEVKKKYKFFILLIVLMIILALPSLVLVKNSTINGNLTCNITTSDNLKCKFRCEIIPHYNDKDIKMSLNGRVIVFHSSWSAIFDTTYNMKSLDVNRFEVELPKRNYNYNTIVSMYDDQGNIGVSDSIVLKC